MLNHTDKLCDSEKFVIILQKYANEYKNQKLLAEEIGIPKQAISDWKNNRRTIRIQTRNSISKKFRLTDRVWLDTFEDAVNFEEQLQNYKIIEQAPIKKRNLIKKNIILPIKEISYEEKELLSLLSNNKNLKHSDYSIQDKSSSFLFELSLLLKNRNQIKEALSLLSIIDSNKESAFKYAHHNKIEHLRAILLSHHSIQDWNQSIHILRLLYVAHYHMEEPEIITLLASNYKRKALYDNTNYRKKEEIEADLLSSAILLYREAYEIKEEKDKYYDAINFAYLYHISSVIEGKSLSDNLELKNMYKELISIWTVDKSNWWEVSSNAEFLMLLGQTDLAILNISDFLEEHQVDKFHIETTLRQVEMYLHFTSNPNAKRFYTFLYESWQYIEKTNQGNFYA